MDTAQKALQEQARDKGDRKSHQSYATRLRKLWVPFMLRDVLPFSKKNDQPLLPTRHQNAPQLPISASESLIEALIQFPHPKARSTQPGDSGSLPYCPSDPTLTTAEDSEPFIGMILDVDLLSDMTINLNNDDRESAKSSKQGSGFQTRTPSSNLDTCDSFDVVRYQLLELVQMELGIRSLKHVTDYAYTPVGVEPAWRQQDGEGLIEGGGRQQDETQALATYANSKIFWGNWWQWWMPWWRWWRNDPFVEPSARYRMNRNAFAAGSHGEVWRGRRRCNSYTGEWCDETLIFKRLKVELGFRVLEAGLREIYFGHWLAGQTINIASQFTKYVDHFFRDKKDELDMWIVFEDAGISLRSFLYTAVISGDFVVYDNSQLWIHFRHSMSSIENITDHHSSALASAYGSHSAIFSTRRNTGSFFIREVLEQLLKAAAFLHEHGVVHRDIKPSNIICRTNMEWTGTRVLIPEVPTIRCVLGDFSSAWNTFASENLFTNGPSHLEQTDEYSPPEALFDLTNKSPWLLTPAFDSWSIGIVVLELLLGTPNVFSVDQRTKAILTQKMERQGSSQREIEKALYLAALSQFCIYSQKTSEWPLRRGDPLFSTRFVKESCTLKDFHRALQARDPLGIGFDESTDTLLHLIWQLLAWNPEDRVTAAQALSHPYFASVQVYPLKDKETLAGEHNAVESQMLDPRLDFNVSDIVDEFRCPKCGRVFSDWHSCSQHATGRRHANFCGYDKRNLPTCLNAHRLLPAHSSSGHCDIRGRRKTIEDFHAIDLFIDQQFYGIFDGHSGNLASKFVASSLFGTLRQGLGEIRVDSSSNDWKDKIVRSFKSSFEDVHKSFVDVVVRSKSRRGVDQSGTTATVMVVSQNEFVAFASLGDSRAVISTRSSGKILAVQITRDHTASNPDERQLVEERGGHIVVQNRVARVNGTLVITRSIGDKALAPVLSQTPDVFVFSTSEIFDLCGGTEEDPELPCFAILASDGLWDKVSNLEAVLLVSEIIGNESNAEDRDENSQFQKAAEALVHEAYIRGSTDNIGVCVVSLVGHESITSATTFP